MVASRFAESHFADSRFTESRFAECGFAKSHFAELGLQYEPYDLYTQCRSTDNHILAVEHAHKF